MEQSIKVYQINKDNYKFDGKTTDDDKITVIITSVYSKYKSKKKFNISEIPTYTVKGLKYFLFVHNFAEKETEWSSFLPPQLIDNVQFNIKNLTLLLFISDGISLFVVVGGKGYEVIVPFINHSFGLMVFSKVIDPNEDEIISINSRGLTGARSGISEQYRNEFKLIDYIRFGKVPVEIHLKLSKSISNEFFGFLQVKENERIKVHAGKSFKVKKNLNFEQLNELILQLGYILERESNDYLTTYIEIKDEKQLNERYRPLLVDAIYNDRMNVINQNMTKFKFDFCDPNKMTQFYEADYYILKEKQEKEDGSSEKYVKFDKVENRHEIYNKVIRRAVETINPMDFFNFRRYIQGVRICSYTDNKISTSSSFLYHFTSEFNPRGSSTSIFLVDTKWYILKQSFIDDLKFECVRAIKNHKLPSHIFYLPWDKSTIKREGEYNLQYNDLDNYIVFDTYTPDGIELCDVMYIDNEKLYLIHVKYGFDGALRELDNQISLSSQRLVEDLKSNKFEYLKKNYDGIKDKSQNLSKYTFQEFKDLFINKQITYVFAFTSQFDKDYLVEENIERYTSNIAKYSLIKCTKDMITNNFDLNICQIRHNLINSSNAT
ncbi:DUF6119 family protein [Emticicia oligotrophica]|uniref:DUF6119 family protein n=1 Tax=Emticicia oligotrophica TaxID=312279 RepID=UPI00273A9D45|nr:TIGR04141 family sporadically distributed protein [Emticicia oligotrophica]